MTHSEDVKKIIQLCDDIHQLANIILVLNGAETDAPGRDKVRDEIVNILISTKRIKRFVKKR